MPARIDAIDKRFGATGRKGGEPAEYAIAAQHEIDQDFPLLRAHAIVGLWGAFEAFHEDLVTEWVRARPSALDSTAVMRLEVPVGQYELLDDAERSVFLVGLLRRELAVDRMPGIGQFSPLLKKVGIFGEVPEATRKDILEMQQVRHVWAHRGGVVDSRFLALCPWREDVSVGERLHVGQDDFNRFVFALSTYVRLVFEWMSEGVREVAERSQAEAT